MKREDWTGTWAGRGGRPSPTGVGEGAIGLGAFGVVLAVWMDKQALVSKLAAGESPAGSKKGSG